MPYTMSDDCTACGTCVDECPSHAITEDEDIYLIDADECTECGACLEICPMEAIIKEYRV